MRKRQFFCELQDLHNTKQVAPKITNNIKSITIRVVTNQVGYGLSEDDFTTAKIKAN